MSNFADRSSRNGEIAAALLGAFPEMACQREGLPILGDDPADRAAFCDRGFQFIEAHPAVAATRVEPFNKNELTTSGHAYGHAVQTQQHSEPISCAHIATALMPASLHASMCVHTPYGTSALILHRFMKTGNGGMLAASAEDSGCE